MRQRRSPRSNSSIATISSVSSSGSFDLPSPYRPFDDILNFRDVGRSINDFTGKKILKEGILFRSARPDDASERDKQRLVDDTGLATVIDLRSNTEHDLASRRRQTSLLASSSTEASSITVDTSIRQHLVELPGVQRHFISLTGRAFEMLLLWRLDWYHFIRVLGLLASGYRKDAVRIIATQIMKPRGLIGLAQDTLDCSGYEIREVFDILADQKSYPILIHCTQGKDRTGLIVMMLLFLIAGSTRSSVPRRGGEGEDITLAAIAADYTKSETELQPELDTLMKEITDIGLDEEYAKTPPGFTEALKSYLEIKYGGVEGYLSSIGIDKEKIENIRQKLLA